MLAGVWRWLGSRWRKSSGVAEIDPIEKILASLRELKKRGASHPEELQELYFTASSLVRELVERRIAARASYKTTEELLEDPRLVEEIDEAHHAVLSSFFSHCNLVRFGAHVPSGTVRDEQIEIAIDLVASEGKEA